VKHKLHFQLNPSVFGIKHLSIIKTGKFGMLYFVDFFSEKFDIPLNFVKKIIDELQYLHFDI
jgi:hypothetical protein